MNDETPSRIEVHRTEDGNTKAVEIIGPQLGSAGKFLAEQEIDDRKMTRLNKLEIVALSYFGQEAKLEENDWLLGFLDDYRAYKMSEEGHERSKLLVEALGKIGRENVPTRKKRDDRSWTQRNLTARNKRPEDEE